MRLRGCEVPRFLIETSHTSEHEGCVRALDAETKYGSHLMTHTEWGCKVGVHSGWIIVDVNDRAEALRLVPPQYRADSRIVELSTWSRDEIEEMVKQFSGQLPDEIVDKRLDAVRALSGVEAAYKKPPAEPASVD